MDRLLHAAALCAMLIALNVAHAAAEACLPLKDTVHGGAVDVRVPGQYCMMANQKQAATPALLQLPHHAATALSIRMVDDNEIIMNASEPQPKSDAPIALYLEDAEGAVVRNNRITLRGRVASAEAIVLKNSPDVVLQNNSVDGGAQHYKLLDR
jgi:hypothetical protein